MPVTLDILATYKGPRPVFRRLLAAGPREDRIIALAMGTCALIFIAQMPKLSREAHLTGQELNMLLGGSLLALIFFLPLGLYIMAFVIHLMAKLFKGQGGSFQARLVLFWSMMAASPVVLFNGLVAGFIGPGPLLNAVGAVWCGIFLWFWIAGMRQAYWDKK